jgi:ferritin
MLSEKMQQALNDQLNAELASAYIYLSMSAYFQANDLAGMAHWMRVQWQEELMHVSKYYDYISDRHGRVHLSAIAEPPKEWNSPLDAFQHALEHERHITRLIGQLVDLSLEERDHSTNNFLQWFVAEQVEEEANVAAIVGQLKIIGDNTSGLFMVDREVAKRLSAAAPATPGA